MVFKPGKSGNPAGRKRGSGVPADVKEMCRAATRQAVEALIKSLADKDNRVKAAQVLLDRGHGKPAQTLEIRATPLDDLDAAALARISDALAAFAGGAGGALGGDPAPASAAEIGTVPAIH